MGKQVKFWQQRWENNQTGFHEGQVNAYLEKYVSLLALSSKSTVFLPLCGKSFDIIWLSELGYSVIGVECSELAVNAFFTENNLDATVTSISSNSGQDDFTLWTSGNISIYCGDFYKLDSAWFQSVTAVFDRAAVVALEQDARDGYVQKLQQLCPSANILLVSLEYPQDEMTGPPFSITEQEVMTLFNKHYKVKLIETNDILDDNDKFKQRGLKSLLEKVFLVNSN